jgi:omega-6 fatty acid desaturase (delta-12 desaturase)
VVGYFLAELAVAFGVAYGFGCSAGAALVTAGLAVLVPFAIWNWISAFVTFQHHTHPRVAWFDRRDEWAFYHGQVRGTTHVVFPFGANLVLHRIMEHTAHHVDPLIPFYRLPTSQERLEERHATVVVVIQWTVRELLRTVAACKLYDYRVHRWMRFDGTYTSERTLPTG